jgi:Flp pilus assembly protein TadG
MAMKKWNSRFFNQRAQSIVELAITLPVLLILILGMVNLGVLINAQIILTQAAWEGARAGVTADPVEEPGDAPIIGAVKASLSGSQIRIP